ncbi:sensor histidine kinase, partial [Escherichia coli]|uniref:sensor histidine kinase n=1 Tax=Escherichia coli TaxID=562 RepID=UPI001952CC0C
MQGDPVALERVVTNLVQNAIDHGGRTGTIAVIVGQNWIEVADEGQGVPAELRERVFEPFFKRHQGT